MWYSVGLFYALFAGLVATYWGTDTPPQHWFIPWVLAGMVGSALTAIALCVWGDLKDARKWRKA
jgi:hypothetical protein